MNKDEKISTFWYFDSIAFSFPLKIQCTPLSLHTYIHIHTKEGKGWRNHYTAHNIHFCLILFMNFCHQNIQSFYLLQPTNLSTPLGNQTDVFSLMILYIVTVLKTYIILFLSSQLYSVWVCTLYHINPLNVITLYLRYTNMNCKKYMSA